MFFFFSFFFKVILLPLSESEVFLAFSSSVKLTIGSLWFVSLYIRMRNLFKNKETAKIHWDTLSVFCVLCVYQVWMFYLFGCSALTDRLHSFQIALQSCYWIFFPLLTVIGFISLNVQLWCFYLCILVIFSPRKQPDACQGVTLSKFNSLCNSFSIFLFYMLLFISSFVTNSLFSCFIFERCLKRPVTLRSLWLF